MFILALRIKFFIFGIKPSFFVKVKSMNCGPQCIPRKVCKNKRDNFIWIPKLRNVKVMGNEIRKKLEADEIIPIIKFKTLLSIYRKGNF